jgi:hypothetical protein
MDQVISFTLQKKKEAARKHTVMYNNVLHPGSQVVPQLKLSVRMRRYAVMVTGGVVWSEEEWESR